MDDATQVLEEIRDQQTELLEQGRRHEALLERLVVLLEDATGAKVKTAVAGAVKRLLGR